MKKINFDYNDRQSFSYSKCIYNNKDNNDNIDAYHKNIFKKTIKTKMKTITEVTKINKRTVMSTRAINTTI